MAINYTEKGDGLHRAIAAAGHKLRQVNQVWRSSNDAAVQAIIDSYDPLPDYKSTKIAAIKAEAVTRMQAVLAGIESVNQVELMAELWLSIASAARSPTAKMTSVINIYNAAKTGIASCNAATTKAQLDAVVVNWP